MFLKLRFKYLPYVSEFHVKNCVQNHVLLTISASPWPVLFLSGLIDWAFTGTFSAFLFETKYRNFPTLTKESQDTLFSENSRHNNFQKDFFSLVCDFFVSLPQRQKTSVKNGAALPAWGKSRKPCPARNHQDLAAAGGKSGKPCPELPTALPPSRKASSGGCCQTRVQGHDLLSHHGGVQRSKKVSSVQGWGSGSSIFSFLPSWIRIQQLKLVRIHPDPQLGSVVDFFLFSVMVLIR
jgi:hypothetical protein